MKIMSNYLKLYLHNQLGKLPSSVHHKFITGKLLINNNAIIADNEIII